MLANIAACVRSNSRLLLPTALYGAGTHVTLTRLELLTLSELAH